MALDATDDAADSSALVLTTMAVLNPYDAMAQEYPSLDLGKNSNLCFAFLHDQMQETQLQNTTRRTIIVYAT